MNHQEIILYKSALAYYHVKQEGENNTVAELQQYDGNSAQMPPRKVIYTKGNACYHPSLVADLCKALGKPL